jgi:hypothetical protein
MGARGVSGLTALIGDVTARRVTAREALEDGDLSYCAELLRELELDLAAWTVWHEDKAA